MLMLTCQEVEGFAFRVVQNTSVSTCVRAGRTGELARAFGIDFFSVLTRGSQYRVEAMMARLAHTQNYLLPTPSKEQAR